jgi:C4-dicarboxylate-specific signal transduction histidine kinase
VQIDIRSMVPWSEWPTPPESSPVQVSLEYEGQRFAIQPGRLADRGWRFDFRKRLAADSQPFDLVAARQAGWSELPWPMMFAWSLAVACALILLQAIQRQAAERRRAEELLRLGLVARLNALGELAAGMAHELNQPLTAVLANTNAASRLLNDDPPELSTARAAMTQAAEQARRASDVVNRLRRAVERPDAARQLQPVNLEDAVRNALYLLEPECARRSVEVTVESRAPAIAVLAEPVALEQIIHNLLTNALQALDDVPAAERALTVVLDKAGGNGVLAVRDRGPGIPAEVLARIFEPFFTTRTGGLGLGLSLCETLAAGMGGTLTAASQAPRGAEMSLMLPLARAS